MIELTFALRKSGAVPCRRGGGCEPRTRDLRRPPWRSAIL